MTRRLLISIAAWLVAVGASALALGRVRDVLAWTVADPRPIPSIEGIEGWPATDSLSRLADAVVEANPFRLSGRPSSAVTGPDATGGPQLAGNAVPFVPPPPRATLVLRAINGPPWTAVIEGIPTPDGGAAVLRSGESLGAFRVRKVTTDAVDVVGPDTTYHLTLPGGFP